MIQDEAKALVTLFREEKDPELKRAIAQQLSLLDSDEARQVLIDVLEEKP